MATSPLQEGKIRLTLPDGYTIDVNHRDYDKNKVIEIKEKHEVEETIMTEEKDKDGNIIPIFIKSMSIPKDKKNTFSDDVREAFGQVKKYG